MNASIVKSLNMKKQSIFRIYVKLFFWVVFISISGNSYAQNSKGNTVGDYYKDLFPDTWVATDALGRSMPGIDSVGPVKNDQRRIVGIFYITWHTMDKASRISPYSGDVSKILKQDPEARLDGTNPLWKERSYHWGEPEMGYFLSQDKYVIRKDISMLADAGVDVLVMDVTNAARYWDEWEVMFTTMQEMKAEGNKVPQFIFWAFNGPTITVVQDLYDRIYKTHKFEDLWFSWDGKPLLLYNGRPFEQPKKAKNPNSHYDPAAKTDPNHPHYNDPDFANELYLDYTKEVKDFFTLRTMWWGKYMWQGERFIGTEDNWCFGYNFAEKEVKQMNPKDLLSTHKGIKEEAAVTPGSHPLFMVGKSWSRKNGQPELNKYDLPVPTYVPWLGKTVENPEGYGIYFQERWDEALKENPQFLYINDWNEWTAGKYPKDSATFMHRKSNYYFVDQYNSEFNRCIQPMKDGYTDNYYMQMAQNIRRYKGVRPIPQAKGFSKITIDGNFAEWQELKPEYLDTRGDVIHRDHPGYGGLNYTNTSGRNDILTSKVGVDSGNLYFYAATAEAITQHSGNNWMLLLIDADKNPETGWYGYDYLINKKVIDGNTTILMKYNPSNKKNPWVERATLNYSCKGNELELAIPRKLLGLTGNAFTCDFKWCDNPTDLINPISLCTDGDTAPNRRFNYRFIWELSWPKQVK